MAEIFGPTDEIFQLSVGEFDEDLGGQGVTLFEDRDAMRAELRRFLHDPRNSIVVRRVLHEGMIPADLSDPAWVDRVADALATGRVQLRRVDDLFHVRGHQAPTAGGALPGVGGLDARGSMPGVGEGGEGGAQPADRGADEEVHIRDQMLECQHHGSNGRQLFEDVFRIQVVPDKGTTVDRVTLHYKDTSRPLPPALTASPGGIEVPQEGASGGYTLYPLDAEYTGDIGQSNFLRPAFWTAYNAKTTYEIRGALSTATVEVFNPRRYKLEFKLPPWKSFKTGCELTHDIERKGALPVRGEEQHVKWEAEASGWTPSALSLDKSEMSYDSRRDSGEELQAKSSSKTSAIKSITFSVDDVEQTVDVLEYIGAILDMYEGCMKIVEAIQENAPKVGWYMTFDLQLFQGALAFEWYWKEHTDHRVYQYIDVNLALTIFKTTFELGIGISGLGFKAQVFAQLEGGLSASLNGRRDDPDSIASIGVPSKGWIKGALGARFEAGNFFQAEGKGETGIELVTEYRINREGNRKLSVDYQGHWTGIEVSAEVSGGLFGLGAKRTWTRTLARPMRIFSAQWPKPEPYRPPHVSKARIQSVMQTMVTQGLNVRVIRLVGGMLTRNEHWTPAQIAEAIADVVDRHETWHRTDKVVEGLAHAIRADLDRLGSRWGRDYVEEADFRNYLQSAALTAHLDAAISPAREMAAQAGA